jgi:uncharacterized protein
MESRRKKAGIVEEARKRQTFFKELPTYLRIIKDTVRNKVDPKAEVYLFGSVAEGTSVYSSDIDVLIVSDEKPEKVRVILWDAGIEEPFEILVMPKQNLEDFSKRAKLIPV